LVDWPLAPTYQDLLFSGNFRRRMVIGGLGVPETAYPRIPPTSVPDLSATDQ
jgi:hypothetical protein